MRGWASDRPPRGATKEDARGMIGATTTLIALLLTAEFGSETVDVKERGAVDLATFECRDTPRSTVIQRACYDPAQGSMIVSVRGAYVQYCDLPLATFAGLMAAPSMGQFFKLNFEGAGAGGRYDCRTGRGADPKVSWGASALEEASLVVGLEPHQPQRAVSLAASH